MPAKRHLSLWFPRLAAERLLRLDRGLPAGPFVVVEDQRGAQVIASMNAEAQAAGLTLGQPLRDGRAMCPGLTSRPANPVAEAAFLTTLRRWAGRFSPWVSEEAPDGLILDMEQLAWRPLPESDLQLKTDVQTPGSDTEAEEYLAEGTLEYGSEMFHGRVNNVQDAA